MRIRYWVWDNLWIFAKALVRFFHRKRFEAMADQMKRRKAWTEGFYPVEKRYMPRMKQFYNLEQSVRL